MPQPSVSLCMIAKNEAENLPGCLESVRGLVDEIIIVDTGSDDDTVRIAESFGAKVFFMPWRDDFSAARNESISHARGEWIFYLDADELLVTHGMPDCIRRTASHPGVDAWSVRKRNYKFGSDTFDTTLNLHLFRRLPGVLFENEVHERVEPSLTRLGARIEIAPFSIDHFGYSASADALNQKLERNIVLSRKHLARDPDDPYCLYYYGVTLLLLDRHEQSKFYFQRALSAEGLPRFLNAMLCNLSAYLGLRQANAGEALEFARRSRELVPCQNTAYLLSGLAHFHKSDYAAALPFLTRARDFLRTPPEQRAGDLSQEYEFIDQAEFHRLIGICLAQTNQFAEAAASFRQYMELKGDDPGVLKFAGICRINSGDYLEGLNFLEKAEELGADPAGFTLPMALARVRLGDFDRARSLLARAQTGPMRDPEMESKIAGLIQSGCSPKISLCMIVKNEEKHLPGCLESVRGMVDEIIVVDTGSTDRTMEIARSFGAAVFVHPWSGDFSLARNESLRHAAGDWVLFLDADERLDPLGRADCLRKAASFRGADAFSVPIRNFGSKRENGPTAGYAVRFFRKFPGIRFSGRVHEGVDQFLTDIGARCIRAPFAVDHLGYEQDSAVVKGKYLRNLALLEKELADNPDNAHAWYHLGLTRVALKEEARAREAFDRALSARTAPPILEAMILNMKSYHHLRAGEPDAALDAASRSLSIAPVQNTARLLKGLSLFSKGLHGEALPFLLEAYHYDNLPPEERASEIGFEDGIEKSDLIEIIGTCFSETDKFGEAVPFLKLTARGKEDPALFERLGICLLNTGDFSGAAHYLEKAFCSGASNARHLALPLSFACFRTGDFSRAAKYFHVCEPRDKAEVEIAFKLIRAMAADENFRPHLLECIRRKQYLFRDSFAEEFSRIAAGVDSPGPGPGKWRYGTDGPTP